MAGRGPSRRRARQLSPRTGLLRAPRYVPSGPAGGGGPDETGQLAGTLAPAEGSFDSSSSSNAQLGGTLAAAAGSFATDSSSDAQIAGTLAPAEGAFEASDVASAQLGGGLPTAEGSFSTSSASDVQLSGGLDPAEGSFSTSSASDAQVAGSLAPAEGAFTASDVANGSLVGGLPTAEGSFATDSSSNAQLGGGLDPAEGSFATSSSSEASAAGTLPQLEVGFVSSTAEVTASLSGTLAPAEGAFTSSSSSEATLGGTLPSQVGSFRMGGADDLVRLSPGVLLTGADFDTTLVEWVAEVPAGTSLTIEVTYDGGSNWYTCTNGASLPNLPGSPDGVSMVMRQTFTENGSFETATLSSLRVEVGSQIRPVSANVKYQYSAPRPGDDAQATSVRRTGALAIDGDLPSYLDPALTLFKPYVEMQAPSTGNWVKFYLGELKALAPRLEVTDTYTRNQFRLVDRIDDYTVKTTDWLVAPINRNIVLFVREDILVDVFGESSFSHPATTDTIPHDLIFEPGTSYLDIMNTALESVGWGPLYINASGENVMSPAQFSKDPEWTYGPTRAVLDLPGASGDYATTPDSAAASVTGDIDFRAYIAPDDWSLGTGQALVTKWVASGSQRSFAFNVGSTGNLSVDYSTTGANFFGAISSANVYANGAVDGQPLHVRVTVDVDNGAADSDFTFYTSTDGSSWTQLGTVQNGGAVFSFYDGTGQVAIGSRNAGGDNILAGIAYSAQVYDGIDGTLVADFNPGRDASAGATTVTSSTTGEVWTINGNAAIVSQMDYQTPIVQAAKIEPFAGTIPNVLVFKAKQGPSLPVEGNGLVTIRNNAVGPYSIAGRGGVEIPEEVDVEASDQDQLLRLALSIAEVRFRGGGDRASVTVGLNPLHDDTDSVLVSHPELGVNDQLFWVAGWSVSMSESVDSLTTMNLSLEAAVNAGGDTVDTAFLYSQDIAGSSEVGTFNVEGSVDDLDVELLSTDDSLSSDNGGLAVSTL